MRKAIVDKEDKAGEALSVQRQCELLGGGNRKRLAARPAAGLGTEDLVLARRIDELYLRFPVFGAHWDKPAAAAGGLGRSRAAGLWAGSWG